MMMMMMMMTRNPHKEKYLNHRPEWFTPEVLRAARYTNEGHTKVDKPASVYYPSVIVNHPDEAGKGRFVHLVSVALQLAQVKWMSTRQLPFYVRGLLRAVRTGVLPEVFAIATITDPDIEVLLDHHLFLWVRVKNWDNYRPIADDKFMPIIYEDTFQSPLATMVVSQVELAEAFLDQRNEGQAPPPLEEYEEAEDESGAIRAKEAPTIKDKAEQKKSGPRQQSESPGKDGHTRAAYIMPSYRYPMAVEGAFHPSKPQHYSVIFNVKRAVQRLIFRRM